MTDPNWLNKAASDQSSRGTLSNNPDVAYRQQQMDPSAAFYKNEYDFGQSVPPPVVTGGTPPLWLLPPFLICCAVGWYMFSAKPAAERAAQEQAMIDRVTKTPGPNDDAIFAARTRHLVLAGNYIDKYLSWRVVPNTKPIQYEPTQATSQLEQLAGELGAAEAFSLYVRETRYQWIEQILPRWGSMTVAAQVDKAHLTVQHSLYYATKLVDKLKANEKFSSLIRAPKYAEAAALVREMDAATFHFKSYYDLPREERAKLNANKK